MKRRSILLALLIFTLLVKGCELSEQAQDDDNQIDHFFLDGYEAKVGNYLITATLPGTVDLSDLKGEVSLSSPVATISPRPANVKDYSSSRTFTVTAESGKQRMYVVSVSLDGTSPNTPPDEDSPELSLTHYSVEETTIRSGDFGKMDLFKVEKVPIDGVWDYQIVIEKDGDEKVSEESRFSVLERVGYIRDPHIENILSPKTEEWTNIEEGEITISLALSKDTYQYELELTATKEQYIVANWRDLQGMSYNLDGEYTLSAHIVFPEPGEEGLDARGFFPIGRYNTPFTGSLNGDGYSISNLFIYYPGNMRVGLFAVAERSMGDSPVVENLTINLRDAEEDLSSVTGYTMVGAIVGELNLGSIEKVSVHRGEVRGGESESKAGGVVGINRAGRIENSYSKSAVKGHNEIGGITGKNEGEISNCYAATEISGAGHLGGLIGRNSGSVVDSFYNSDISGTTDSGRGGPIESSEMEDESTFTNWDFDNIWSIDAGTNDGYPYLAVER